jgi:polyisoprenyl-teichoic acid--peptidoglycan teichoic acid transferase
VSAVLRWRGRAPAARRSWPQRLVLVGGCASALALVASAGGLAYVYRKYERLPRVELTDVLAGGEDAGAGEPENYLIVGVDNASGLDDDDPVRRGRDDISRSDTIMVLRIDPESRQAALLSLPRDMWVPIAGTDSNQRINSTIEEGGPRLLIRTIDEYLGIPIHHYLQVDFAAFQGLVEAVDGVPVYVPHAARDRQTGLNVPKGCVTLDPEQALAYVRSRHYEERIDEDWVEDARSDLGRIERQQDFIRRALSRAIDRGARNPRKLDELIDVGLDGITVDDGLTADDIFRLGNRFRSFDPEDLVSYSVPTEGDFVGEAQILRLVEDQAEPVLAIFRGASESELSPASVRIEVLNGSGEPGQASEVATELAEVGFGVSGTGEDLTFDNARTVVEYPPGQRDAADLVARWLEAGAELREVEDADGLVLVTGADWDGVRTEPVQPEDTTDQPESSATTSSLPPSSDLTTTTSDGSDGTGSDTTDGTAASSSTSTTIDRAAQAC